MAFRAGPGTPNPNAGQRSIFKLDVEGGAELAKMLNELPWAFRRLTLTRILQYAAEPIREGMAANAPKGPDRPPPKDRKTQPVGHLKDSITTQVVYNIGYNEFGEREQADEFHAVVAVGPDKAHYYGIFHEYGTVKLGARPFMRPAFDENAPEALDIIREKFWQELVAFTRNNQIPVSAGPGGGGLL